MQFLKHNTIAGCVVTAIAGMVFATSDVRFGVTIATSEMAKQEQPRTLESIVSLWERHEAAGPLAAMPIRRTHLAEAWGSKRHGLFAGLYPADKFESFDDYEVFIWYTSSIQQFLIRDGEVDLDWFVPEAKQEGSARLFKHLENRSVLVGRRAKEAVVELGLPAEFGWIPELNFRKVSLDASDDGLELSAHADEGFLTLFAIPE